MIFLKIINFIINFSKNNKELLIKMRDYSFIIILIIINFKTY